MSHKLLAAVAAAVSGIAVGAVISAPVSQARPVCDDVNGTNKCQTNGSVSIKARPGTTAPPANQPVFPWMGRGLPGSE